MAPPLNTLLRAGFRQGEALGYLITLIESVKKGIYVLRCSVFTENDGFAKSKKKVEAYTFSDVLFSSESIMKRKKKGLHCSC